MRCCLIFVFQPISSHGLFHSCSSESKVARASKFLSPPLKDCPLDLRNDLDVTRNTTDYHTYRSRRGDVGHRVSNFLGPKGDRMEILQQNVPYKICTHFLVNTRGKKKKGLAVSWNCVIIEKELSLFPRDRWNSLFKADRGKSEGGKKESREFYNEWAA